MSRAGQRGAGDAIAVASGLAVYVVADGGVTKADYVYTETAGVEHTVAMDIADGVATSVLRSEPNRTLSPAPGGANPSAPVEIARGPEIKITKVTAYSGSSTVWDGPPAAGR